MNCSPETVDHALQVGRNRLRSDATGALDSQLLLAHVLGVSREWLLAHGDSAVSTDQCERFAGLLERRAKGEPVAYLRGFVEWYGQAYDVSPAVLVPRPETELVLEQALKVARDTGAHVIVDVGTGSAVVAIELARGLPGSRIYATDASPDALDVARRNADRHGVAGQITLLQGDLLAPLPEKPDLIVANLPYLSAEMMLEAPPELAYEPLGALVGGTAGTELFERLFREVAERGWNSPIVLEIDPRQREPITNLAHRILPGRQVTVDRDYAGWERILTMLAEA